MKSNLRLCLSPLNLVRQIAVICLRFRVLLLLPWRAQKVIANKAFIGCFSNILQLYGPFMQPNNIAFITHQIRYCERLSYNPPGSNIQPWQPDVCQGDVASHATNPQGYHSICFTGNASNIQSDLDRRNLVRRGTEFREHPAGQSDTLPGMRLSRVSDRDSYRRTLELYLKDGVLTQAEQLLLWEERRG